MFAQTESRHQKGISSITVGPVDKQLRNVSINVTGCVCVCARTTGRMQWCRAHLYYVEDHILIETVEDALCNTVVAPCTVDQQKLLEVGELAERERGKEKSLLG